MGGEERVGREGGLEGREGGRGGEVEGKVVELQPPPLKNGSL